MSYFQSVPLLHFTSAAQTERNLSPFDVLLDYDLPEPVRQVYNYIQDHVRKDARWKPYASDIEGTITHQFQVADLSVKMGKMMGLGLYELNQLYAAALMHDVGKFLMDPTILFKSERFTQEDRRYTQDHVKLSADVILDVLGPAWATIAQIIEQHHECDDGTGYPKQLKEQEIERAAGIIAIADIHDAMVSKRCYKPGLSSVDAANEICDRGPKHSRAAVQAYYLSVNHLVPRN